MSIVLNGTTGITNDSGYTGDGVSFADSTPANTLVTTSGGNVGIGTSSPAYKVDIGSVTDADLFRIRSTAAANNTVLRLGISGNNAVVSASGDSTGVLQFNTYGSERARITSGGDFLLNTTSFTGAGDTFRWSTSGVQLSRNANGDQIAFFTASAFSGKISTSGTTTTYGTSSDYRLKHDITPMTGALEKVAQLKPVTYKWNADNSNGQGFIAHELQEVSPDCVVGEKDAVDAEGNPLYQTVDTSFLVATLTAAIQEQQALIESLTARVVALETQP